MRYFYTLFLTVAFLGIQGCTNQRNEDNDNNHYYITSDSNASVSTRQLGEFLNTTMQKGIMIGHQDDLIYGNTWFGKEGGSDIRRLTGSYPAVAGWDLGKIETGSAFNIDSVPADLIKRKIIEANSKGIISTISWHADNPLTGGQYSDTSSAGISETLFPDSLYHSAFTTYLDNLSDFFKSLKDSNGHYIPVIFRPYMAYNKDAYWWGAPQNSADDYGKIWRKTVDYFRNEKNIHHILYAYSVYKPLAMEDLSAYYPGDKYVDIVGIDLLLDTDKDPEGTEYSKDLSTGLQLLKDFSARHKKIPSVTCTGMEGIKMPGYFTGLLYPVISRYKLSYVLFWRNAWNMEEHYYIPVPGHPASDNFIEFAGRKDILLLDDLKK